MIAITNVINEVSYKFADCMRLNSETTNKCIIEISRHNRSSIFTTIYKHYTLAQIHANIKMAIRLENQPAHLMVNNRKSIETPMSTAFTLSPTPSGSGSIQMVNIDSKSMHDNHIDHIPRPQLADDAEVRDIFVFDNDEKCIVSIPCDKDITLFEFMHSNPSHLKPSCSVYAMSMIYKMYVIDNAYLNKNVKNQNLSSTVYGV